MLCEYGVGGVGEGDGIAADAPSPEKDSTHCRAGAG